MIQHLVVGEIFEVIMYKVGKQQINSVAILGHGIISADNLPNCKTGGDVAPKFAKKKTNSPDTRHFYDFLGGIYTCNAG